MTHPEPLPVGHPLYTHPKMHLTPHASSNWSTALPALHQQILLNIEAVAHHTPPSNLVIRSGGY